jgi:hypothetical protein
MFLSDRRARNEAECGRVSRKYLLCPLECLYLFGSGKSHRSFLFREGKELSSLI